MKRCVRRQHQKRRFLALLALVAALTCVLLQAGCRARTFERWRSGDVKRHAVSPDDVEARDPHWSPDGQKLAFTVENVTEDPTDRGFWSCPGSFWVVSATSGHVLAMQGGFLSGWRDKDHVLWTDYRGDKPAFQALDVRTGRNRPVAVQGQYPVFSPDGAYVAVQRGEDRHRELTVATADGRRTVSVIERTNGYNQLFNYYWSPSGRYLTVEFWPAMELAPARRRIYTPGGRLVRELPPLVYSSGGPICWSPDEKEVFYCTKESAGGELYSLRLRRGSKPRLLARVPRRGVWAVRASPNGRWLAFSAGRLVFSDIGVTHGAVYLFDLRTRCMAGLVSGPSDDPEKHGAAWSPDGSRLAYVEDATIWVSPPTPLPASRRGPEPPRLDLKPRRVSPNEVEFVYWPTWSPDGDKLAFHGNKRTGSQYLHFWVIRAATGQVVAEGPESPCTIIGWLDKDRLLWNSIEAPAKDRVRQLDLRSGRSRRAAVQGDSIDSSGRGYIVVGEGIGPQSKLMVKTADGRLVGVVARTTRDLESFSHEWSPSQRYLAVACWRRHGSGGRLAWARILTPQGRLVRGIPSWAWRYCDYFASWMPGEREVILGGNGPRGLGLYSMGLDATAKPRLLTRVAEPDVWGIHVSLNGRWVAYSAGMVENPYVGKSEGAIYLFDLRSRRIAGAVTGPVRGSEGIQGFWSPDSTQLAYEAYEAIYVVTVP